MAIVNNFLCFDLELGGYVIGIIGHVISILFMGYAGYRILTITDLLPVIIAGGEIFIFLVYFITSITLIIGTKKRSPNIVFPSLIASLLVIISIVVNLVFLNWLYIPFLLYILYTIVCILSLCQKFREENIKTTVQGYEPARTREV